ncbi:hypothetical protein [Pleomorphomonas oryzae]|uniref:hypothetical protein n=1 Tax=Pleomorphomonas oryzae TaxID=261934 RepID=UPI0003FB6806|nr:hypothetical protein [Pleomorphomonas oryzae]
MNWINLVMWLAAGIYTGKLLSDRRALRALVSHKESENDRLHHMLSWARTALAQHDHAIDAHAAAINFAIDRCHYSHGLMPNDIAGFLNAWRCGEWGRIVEDWPDFDLTTAGLTAETIAELKEVGSDG